MPIKRPFARKEVIHTQADIESWETVILDGDSGSMLDLESTTKELRGKTFLVSPAIGTAGKEQNHHYVEIEIEGRAGSTINIHMGHAPVESQYDRLFTTYYYTIDFLNRTPGTFIKDFSAQYGGRRFNWWLIEIKPDVKVTQIKHSWYESPEGVNTSWMHDPVKTHEFMGGRMHYSVSYPCDYDSEEDRLYPLVLSVGGSGELGDDKRILTQIDPGCIITKRRDFFENDKYRAFHVTLQVPYYTSFPEDQPVPEPEMYPYHDGWSRYYHERGYGMIGAREIVNMLLADPDHKIDPNRIYLTGFSGGGLFTFEGVKGLRDILAAAVPCAAWPIAGAYSDPTTHYHWEVPYDGKDSIRDRLRKEMLRSHHIPTIVGVGTNDNMKYGSRAWQAMAEELGRDSQLKEYPTSHGGSPKLVWGDPANVEWLFSQTKSADTPEDPYPDADYTLFNLESINIELRVKEVSEEVIKTINDMVVSIEMGMEGDLDADGDVDNKDIGVVTGNFTGSNRLANHQTVYDYAPIEEELVAKNASPLTIQNIYDLCNAANMVCSGDLDLDGDIDNADISKILGNYTGSKPKNK